MTVRRNTPWPGGVVAGAVGRASVVVGAVGRGAVVAGAGVAVLAGCVAGLGGLDAGRPADPQAVSVTVNESAAMTAARRDNIERPFPDIERRQGWGRRLEPEVRNPCAAGPELP